MNMNSVNGERSQIEGFKMLALIYVFHKAYIFNIVDLFVQNLIVFPLHSVGPFLAVLLI